jgi:hypothetical protein
VFNEAGEGNLNTRGLVFTINMPTTIYGLIFSPILVDEKQTHLKFDIELSK